MAKSFTSLDDIKSAIEGMGFKIGDVWYDGNRSRPVFVCSREGLPHDIEVWAESPKYVNGVTIKDVSARDFDMVDGGEDVAGLKKAIKKALVYMGAKESKMKITVKEAKGVYTADDFKAAAEEERFKNRAEIWADQFNAHAEYIGLKDRAHVEKDLHGCDSVVWDYGYIVAKDPFGEKWQVRFGDNAYTLANIKVTPYMYKQMDSMTGFKGEAYSDYKPLMDKVYDWYGKKDFWKEEDFWKDLEALYAHNYPNVGFKFVLKGDDECAEIYTKDGLLFTYSWKPVGRDRRHRSIAKDGSGSKHPGFNFKDDVHYMYRGITGKDLSDEWYERVSESRKSERVAFGARTISIPIGTFHSYDLAQDVANRITSACDYIEADARQQGHRTDEWVTVLTFEPKYFRDFKSYYTENYDSYCYMVTSTRDDFIRPDELEVRAYKSESRKNEASDEIKVSDEDVLLKVFDIFEDNSYGSFSVDTPNPEGTYSMRELKDIVAGMVEDCGGYSDISRDGSEVLVQVFAPINDDSAQYPEELVFEFRCTARIVHASLEQVVEYLER